MISKPKVAAVSLGERPHWLKLRIGSVILIVLLIVAGGTYYEVSAIKNRNAAKLANAADQIILEKSLQASVDSSNDPYGAIYTANRLLTGEKSGMFNISNSELTQIYLDDGAVFMQLKEYNSAINSYQSALKIDNSIATKEASMPVEIEAKYMLGERKQLVSLYQELIDIINSQGNKPFSTSLITMYQNDIQALQNNQGLQF